MLFLMLLNVAFVVPVFLLQLVVVTDFGIVHFVVESSVVALVIYSDNTLLLHC